MASTSFRDLVVWQQAMEFVVQIYEITKAYPRDEIYCLTNQMRRAANSIPCNIAEGQGRRTRKDFVHFLSIASGSLREVETQITISERLGYIKPEAAKVLLEQSDRIGRLLKGLSRSLERD